MFRNECGIHCFDAFACWHAPIVLPSHVLFDAVAVVFGPSSLAGLLSTACRRSPAMVLVTSMPCPAMVFQLVATDHAITDKEEAAAKDATKDVEEVETKPVVSSAD